MDWDSASLNSYVFWSCKRRSQAEFDHQIRSTHKMRATEVQIKGKTMSINDLTECGGKVPFPYKLFQMLQDSEDKGFRHIVSWNSNGKSFKVHDSVAFTTHIIPRYFKQTRYKSFQRQLCLYGFDRILSGPGKGSRYHKNFIRGNFRLCREVKYIGIKSRALQQAMEDENVSVSKQPTKMIQPSSQTLQLPCNPIPDTSVSSFKDDIGIAMTLDQMLEMPQVRHIVSPSMSPVSSEMDVSRAFRDNFTLPTVPDLFDDCTDLGLFEGMAFHCVDPINENQSVSRRQEFSESGELELFSKQLEDAWKKGFETALSFPPDTCTSIMSRSTL